MLQLLHVCMYVCMCVRTYVCMCVYYSLISLINSAFSAHPCDTKNLQCNTEKDKIKLHDRSAGRYVRSYIHILMSIIVSQ